MTGAAGATGGTRWDSAPQVRLARSSGAYGAAGATGATAKPGSAGAAGATGAAGGRVRPEPRRHGCGRRHRFCRAYVQLVLPVRLVLPERQVLGATGSAGATVLPVQQVLPVRLRGSPMARRLARPSASYAAVAASPTTTGLTGTAGPTLDSNVSSSAVGSTGTIAPSAPSDGATGVGTALATDPLHGSITSSTVLGPLTARFLQAIGAGTNLGESEDVLQKALANVPAGLPKSELTKIAGLANVLGPTGPHQGGAISGWLTS